MRQPLKLTLLCAGAAAIVAAARVQLTQTEVFRSGEGGYHTYRIPALITSRKGTLLAFCEGRRQSRGDSGDIDLLLKRSFGLRMNPLRHGVSFAAGSMIKT